MCIFPDCTQTFAKVKDLSRHEEIHIGFHYACPRNGCDGESTRPDHLKRHIARSAECSSAALEVLQSKGIDVENAKDISPKDHIREHFIVRLEVTLPTLS